MPCTHPSERQIKSDEIHERVQQPSIFQWLAMAMWTSTTILFLLVDERLYETEVSRCCARVLGQHNKIHLID